VSGLLNPFAYLRPPFSDARDEKGDKSDISDLPDTSILFHRYLECGKLINVWDWYQSFALVCEVQREREQGGKGKAKTDGKEARSPQKSKTKTKTPTKGKVKGKEKELPPESEDEVQEEGEESWKLQVQARFMRALHELDLLGFIKHTGRKTDHVMRTVWLGED
jgi:origin recognition complex subunit 3